MSDLGRHDLAAVIVDTAESGRGFDKSGRLRLYTATVLAMTGDTVTVDFGDGHPVANIPVWRGSPSVGKNVQVLGAPGRFLALGARGVGASSLQTMTTAVSVPPMVTADPKILTLGMAGWSGTPIVSVEWLWTEYVPSYLWQSIRFDYLTSTRLRWRLSQPFVTAAAPTTILLTAVGVWSSATPPTFTPGG